MFKRDYCIRNETELQQWIDELKDLSLKGRLDEFLSRTVWSYRYSDEGRRELEGVIRALCDEKLKLIKDILEEGHYDKDTMRQFTESLAIEDQTRDFMELIKSMKNTSLYVTFCMGYYLGVYKKYNKIPDDMISFLDTVESSDPNFSLWGSILFDISDSGFKRILSLIRSASEMNVFAV